MILPPFTNGIEYRELSPKEGKRKWRWRLLKTVSIKLPFAPRDMAFYDRAGVVWGVIECGFLTISQGYEWNGCSPKTYIPILRIWAGTPDCEGNLLASLAHDLLYQASGTDHFPFSRTEVDAFFLAIMRAKRFPLANLYHGAVDDFGGAYWGQDRGLKSALI